MRSGAVTLASGSPRRRDLLEATGYRVTARPSGADETWPAGASLRAGVLEICRRKMEAARRDHRDDQACWLSADTVVVLDDERLGKPEDDHDAGRMLRALSGREHVVATGFRVEGARPPHLVELMVTTRVWFRALLDDEIERYVVSGEPRDKAGAYGIQGLGGALIDRVEGSYTNVIGLPLAEVLRALEAVA